MNRNRQFYNLISSDEDDKTAQPPTLSRNQSQTLNSRTPQHSISNTHQQPTKNNTTQTKAASQQFDYSDVCNFRSFKNTASLESYYLTLKEFIESGSKNVLFVFGPSGCGKTLLIQTMLKGSLIKYEWVLARSRQNEEGENTYEDIFDMFYREIRSKSMIREDVLLFNDFPLLTDESPTHYLQKYKQFRDAVYDIIKTAINRNKYIFILNSEIYSAFHVLSENSETKALSSLLNVSVLKMEAYGKREMKAIMEHFLKCYPSYYSVVSQTKDFDEIILEAQGDARKALHQIYYRKLTAFAQKMNPLGRSQTGSNYGGLLGKSSKKQAQTSRVYQYQEQEVQKKTSICHMLGKFLYGKRFNIYYNPNIKAKKDNEISAYYKEEELARLDPKFYFRPVQMLERSRLALPQFRDLLQENFIHRYGKVKDIANMYNIFRYHDAYLEDSTNRFQLMRQMEQMMKELLTWGILIYNRNSVKATTLFKIQRSKNALNERTIQKKLNIIKSYFMKPEHANCFIHYRIKDIIMYALHSKSPRPKQDYSPMHQKLVELINDNRRSSRLNDPVSAETNIMKDEEQQEMTLEGCDRINQIQKMIRAEIDKKQRLVRMVCEDSEEEDIDSD